MIRKFEVPQRSNFVKLSESNLFMNYELSKIKPPSENLYSDSNKR